MKFFFVIATIFIFFPPMANASVNIGGTRVIFEEGKRDASIIVYSSADETSPHLIQSFVDNAGEKGNIKNASKPPFIVTPPLFRLEPGKENTIKIIRVGGELAKDRESVFWLNVKAIPGLDKKNRTQNTLKLSLKNRIKLFYRPVSLSKADMNDRTFDNVQFIRNGNVLIVRNPTPYFITFNKLRVGGININTDFVMTPPKGEARYLIPSGVMASGVEWTSITDFGSSSELRKGVIKNES